VIKDDCQLAVTSSITGYPSLNLQVAGSVRVRILSCLLLCAGMVAVVLLSPAPAIAAAEARLSKSLLDRSGWPLEHGVVSLHSAQPMRAAGDAVAIMDQRQLQFDPTVLTVETGTPVPFHNEHDVRHHIYSISQPNAVELKLHHGESGQSDRFEHPGVVVLGCNIPIEDTSPVAPKPAHQLQALFRN